MKRFTVFLFAALFMPGGVLRAQNFPPLDAAPEAYTFAARLARPSQEYWRDLAETALWASSVNAPGAAERAVYLDRINTAVKTLAASPNLPRNPKERGEFILAFMHKNFLKAYSERQTRLDELLRTGRYNCVSSAALYLILSLSSGLNAGGVMTKDHAFATITAGGETFDVETTNLYGFDPGNRKEFHDGFGKATGYAYVSAKNYRDRAAINPGELVSLILSNRITELEQSNRFADAVPLSINRQALLSQNIPVRNSGTEALFFEDPRKDMMTRLFNYGAWLVRNSKDDDALAWAAYAGARFPDKNWQDFAYAALNNKEVKLLRANRIAEARAALEAGKSLLSAEQYRNLDAITLEAELTGPLNTLKTPAEAEALLARINEAWNRLPEKSRGEIRTAAILKEAELSAKAGDWLGAINWIDAAIARYGANSRLENARRLFRQNRINELHNSFAALYNRKDLEGARAFIAKALQEFPGENRFRQDLSLVEQALKNQ
jgi:hypothetical protein